MITVDLNDEPSETPRAQRRREAVWAVCDKLSSQGIKPTQRNVKMHHSVDFFPVDLNATPEALVSLTRYWLGLFSHRRQDSLWKGMLQIRLEDEADDTAALALLNPADAAPNIGGTP